VTRRGETLGVYVPTPRKFIKAADQTELREAADRLAAVLSDVDEERHGIQTVATWEGYLRLAHACKYTIQSHMLHARRVIAMDIPIWVFAATAPRELDQTSRSVCHVSEGECLQQAPWLR
jgi:hypothetical protein